MLLKMIMDFSGGSVVNDPAASAEDKGLNPWSRKILHAAEPLSSCATTMEALAPRPHSLQQEKSSQ